MNEVVLIEMKVTDVPSCPRCGKDHVALLFQKLGRPMKVKNHIFEHWGSCPETSEPILMHVLDEKGE